MKKILLFVLVFSATVRAADTEVQDLVEMTAVASADVLYIVDDPVGAPASRKITALNLFDMIDTFAELNTITADKTLVNEEDAITWDSIITFSTNIAFSDAATIDQSANNYFDFTENSDIFQIYFDGSNIDLIWSDGVLNLRNAEDTDAIVEIEGKDAGEKGILRVLSDGDDKYIELYNDDTDAVITNSAGNIIINPVGLGIVIGDNGNEDYTITFDGDTSNGILNYDEDNADFEFDQDVITTGVFYSPAFDAPGAEDMDYGSADITDHTFTTDDMTFIMDGGITVSTGDFIKIGTTQWNSADEIDGTKIKDADYGDIDVSAGGAWTLDTDSVADNEIDYANVTFADFDFETNWKMWHSNGAGDVTEITLGANGTFLESNGAAAAPAFRVLAAGDIPSILYNVIGNPSASGSISFDDTETATYTTVQDTAGSFISFINSNADVSNQVYMLDLDYSADTTQDNADFIRLQDAGSTLIVFEEEGKITMTPSGVDDATIISIIPSVALTQADAFWCGIQIDGDALDPGDVDNIVLGVDVDLSGVDLTNNPYVEALELIMPTGGVALHIEEGKIKQEFTSGSDAGAEYTAIDMFMDASNQAATSETHAIDVAVVGGDPAGLVVGIGTHTYVAPVHQHIGVFSTPDQAGADSEAGFFDDSGTDYIDGVDGIEQFTADDDAIWISAAAIFTEIEVIFSGIGAEVPATRSVTPTFWYWKDLGVDAWTQFFPADDTDGFQQSGTIRWETTAVPSWLSADVVNISAEDPGEAAAGYWVAIIRTVNADPGAPTPTTVKTGAITEFSWDETGAIDVLSMEADTITEGGNAVPNATDHLGFFGGTTSAELLAEISNETGSGLLVFATAPVFTTSIQLTGADADPAAAAGTIVYDNTIAVLSGGALRWYDNDSVRVVVDLETDPVDGDDDKVIAYDSAADGFYMKADADTGGVTKLNDIGDADGAGTVVSGANEHLWTWENDAANEVFMNFSSIDADTANNQWVLELSTYDDGDANLFFFRCRDDVDTTPNTVFEIAADGATSMDAGLTVGGSITEGGVAVPNIDETDWVAAAEMADADHGDVAWSGGDASVEACTIADSTYASCYVGIFQAATGADQPFYTDGALTYDASNGTLATTNFSGGGASLTSVDAITGDSATAFFDAGTIEHEWGGLQANLAAYTGLIGITGADTTVEVDLLSELLTAMGDVTAFITDDDMPAVGADPDIDAAGEIGRDSDGANETGDSSLRGYDGANQFLYCKEIKHLTIPIVNPDSIEVWTGRVNPSQPVWFNTTGMTFTITEVYAISDTDNYDFTLFESASANDMSDDNDVSIIAIECDANGTECFTDTEAAIGHAVEADHAIIFEDTLGSSKGVLITISGWFNSDVN